MQQMLFHHLFYFIVNNYIYEIIVVVCDVFYMYACTYIIGKLCTTESFMYVLCLYYVCSGQ